MHVLALYNIKGGVGKTTAAVNLAYLSAAEGNRTLLWDLDPQGGATFYLQADPAKRPKPKTLVRKKGLAKRVQATPYPCLDVLPADLAYRHADLLLEATKKPARRLSRLLAVVAKDYDYVFLDCPPSMSRLAESVFDAADLLLVPLIPTPVSLRSLEQIQACFPPVSTSAQKMVPFFSMVDRRKTLHRRVTASPADRPSFCANTVPYLSCVEKMGLRRAPLPAFSPRSPGALAFLNLWQEVKGRIAGAAG